MKTCYDWGRCHPTPQYSGCRTPVLTTHTHTLNKDSASAAVSEWDQACGEELLSVSQPLQRGDIDLLCITYVLT